MVVYPIESGGPVASEWPSERDVDSLCGFQNDDVDEAWREHEPEYGPDWRALRQEALEAKREKEAASQVPSWAVLFGFVEGFKCGTFVRVEGGKV